jgi:predicted RNA binding protein YcfA (HicA-like mRNA interferase family)
MDTRAIIAALRAAGWEEVRVTGDHHFFRHPKLAGLINVPHPKKQLPLGTLRSIEKLCRFKLRGS